MNDVEELRMHIQSLTDEELLLILEESTKVYTEAAKNIAKEVAQQRGGPEVVKQRLHQNQKKDDQELPKQSHSASAFSFLSHFFSTLMPKKERYKHYPSLYAISMLFRMLALFISVMVVILIIIIIYFILIGRYETGIIFLFSLLYLGIAFVILFAISEVLQVLVDIEKNTR